MHLGHRPVRLSLTPGLQPLGARSQRISASMNPSISPSMHGGGVAGLVTGPQVLDVLVRVQHVVADLGAPAALADSPRSSFSLAACSSRLRSSSLAWSTAIALARFWIWLRSFWQETTIPVGRWVIRTAESVVLTPWPPGPLDRKTSIRISSSGISMWSACWTTGSTSTPGERGLPAALVVVLGDPHHPVGAVLAAQRAVGVGRLDREGGRLDPGLLRIGGVIDLGRVAVPLGPAQVDPPQPLRPVGRVGAAGLRGDGDQRLARVVLAGQQGPDLQLVDLLAEPARLCSASSRVGSSFSLSASSNTTPWCPPGGCAGRPAWTARRRDRTGAW